MAAFLFIFTFMFIYCILVEWLPLQGQCSVNAAQKINLAFELLTGGLSRFLLSERPLVPFPT